MVTGKTAHSIRPVRSNIDTTKAAVGDEVSSAVSDRIWANSTSAAALGPNHAIFIDWEDMIRVDKNTVAIAEYLMLVCMMADSKALVKSLYGDAIQTLDIEENKVKQFVESIENEDVRETFEIALEEGRVQHQTMQEFYKKQKTA